MGDAIYIGLTIGLSLAGLGWTIRCGMNEIDETMKEIERQLTEIRFTIPRNLVVQTTEPTCTEYEKGILTPKDWPTAKDPRTGENIDVMQCPNCHRTFPENLPLHVHFCDLCGQALTRKGDWLK